MNKEETKNDISNFAKEIWNNSKTLYETNSDQPQYVEVNKIFELVDKYNAISEQEKDKLESNWKALKEWLLEKNLPTNETIITEWIKIFNVLNKMSELEGDK